MRQILLLIPPTNRGDGLFFWLAVSSGSILTAIVSRNISMGGSHCLVKQGQLFLLAWGIT